MMHRRGEHCDMMIVAPGQPPAQSYRWSSRITPTGDPRVFGIAVVVRSRYMMIPSGHGLFPYTILQDAAPPGGSIDYENQQLSRTGKFAIVRFTWFMGAE